MDSIAQQLLAEPRLQLYLAGALCILATFLLVVTRSSATEPPGPKFVIPFLGESFELLTTPPLKFQWSRVRKYGPVFKMHVMGKAMYMIAEPEALRRIAKNEGVEFLMPGAGAEKMFGYIKQMLHRKWHAQWRKYILLAIGPVGVAQLFPKLQAVVDRHVAAWEEQGRVSLMDKFKEVAFNFGVDVITGVKLPEGVDPGWLKEQIKLVINGLYSVPLDLPGTPLRRGLAAKQAIGKAFEATLLRTIEEVNRKIEQLGDKDPDGSVLPLLEASLLSSKGYDTLDMYQAVDRVVGNLLAATDTTRYMIWIVMSLVGRSPRVVEKLREEQAAIVAKHGPRVTYEAVQEMAYLDATVKEALRIMPASVFTFRKTTEPFRVGKYVIPTGATIALSSVLPQTMDPVVWDGDLSKPIPPHMDWENNFDDAFRPERWLPNSDAKPRAFATFGTGEFLCLGMNLAYTEAKLLMATVLRKYRYSFVDPDWMNKCGYFPGPSPRPGSDMVELTLDPVPGC